MNKKTIATVLIMLALAVALSGCGLQMPLAEQIVSSDVSVSEDSKPVVPTTKLYVSGAVQNDGYFTVPQLCDYKTVISIVGVTERSFMPSDPSALLLLSNNSLIVNYVVEGVVYYSVDVNGVLVTSRLSIDGIDDEVINAIADYIEANGKITNRNQLKTALGEDFSDNYYKFYIPVEDYA